MFLYILSLVMAPFGVYRVALMLATEEGPFEVFQKLRNLYVENNWVGRGIRCPACISFWAGLVMALVLSYLGQYTLVQMGICWLGFSGIAVYLAQRRF
jgi:hypothetical protein